MKKFLRIMAVGLVALFPFSVFADSASIKVGSCTEGENDNVTCKITYNISGTTGFDSLTVTLTEAGGASVDTGSIQGNGDWTATGTAKVDTVTTVTLTSIGVTGEGDLMTFTYKKSGTTDCKVSVALKNGNSVDVTPNKPSNPDTPTDNKQTGSTLPYIALGGLALVAAGIYVATQKKAKMYKI